MASAAAVVPIALMVAMLAGAAAATPHADPVPGQRDYATYCAPCHGSCGDGDGPLARMLIPMPSRHSNASYMNSLSDEYLFRLLNEGGTALGKSPLMGAWGKILTKQQIRDLVGFLRSLSVSGETQANH